MGEGREVGVGPVHGRVTAGGVLRREEEIRELERKLAMSEANRKKVGMVAKHHLSRTAPYLLGIQCHIDAVGRV